MHFPNVPSRRRAVSKLLAATALVGAAFIVAWALWRFELWQFGAMLLLLPVALLFGAWDEFEKALCEWSGTPYDALDFDEPVPELRWEVDDESVTLREFGGRNRSYRVRYSELESVRVVTSDGGPFVEDFFYLLYDGEATIQVPLGAACKEGLLPRLQKLPGFDNRAAIEATASTENAVFVLWESGADGSA